jgi:hypothetical protein
VSFVSASHMRSLSRRSGKAAKADSRHRNLASSLRMSRHG